MTEMEPLRAILSRTKTNLILDHRVRDRKAVAKVHEVIVHHRPEKSPKHAALPLGASQKVVQDADDDEGVHATLGKRRRFRGNGRKRLIRRRFHSAVLNYIIPFSSPTSFYRTENERKKNNKNIYKIG